MRNSRFGSLLTLAAGLLLSFASLAHAAPFAYVTQSMSNTVAVIDTETGAATPITVGDHPWGVAVNPAGTHVYVANSLSDTLSVIEIASNTVVHTVTLGGGEETSPFGVAVHPDGSRVYVTLQQAGSVAVIDTSTNALVDTLSVGMFPAGIAIDPGPNPQRLYVANVLSNDVSIVNLATHAVTTVPLPGENQKNASPVGVAVDRTGARVYVTNVGTGKLAVIEALDTPNPTLTLIPVGGAPIGVAIHPNGKVYLANVNSVSIVTPTTPATVVTVPVPGAAHLYGIGVTPSGSQVWVADQDMNNGAMFVLENDVPVSQVAVANGPTAFGLFMTPGGETCDTTELEKQLTECRAALASCEAENNGLRKQVADLKAENEKLRKDLAAANATIASFIKRLFDHRTDGNVAAAARDAALAQLNEAKAVAPHDFRVRLAQIAFNAGLFAMTRHDWGGAVYDFRLVDELTDKVLHRW
jgi:YVTN family beta-propeller protein